jgi:dephospho-CoA kinase
MFLIGLTGGIAAGKSTVAKLWSELGAIEIDADLLAREVVEPGTEGASQIRKRFGESFFDATGALNRAALASLVFADRSAKADLEGIVHPLVQKRAREIIEKLPKDSIVIYTVPLLVEANVSLPFDAVVTVEAPEDIRIQRLIESRSYTPEQAIARIASQAQPIERVARADHVLNSNQSIEQLRSDARQLWNEFLARAQRTK